MHMAEDKRCWCCLKPGKLCALMQPRGEDEYIMFGRVWVCTMCRLQRRLMRRLQYAAAGETEEGGGLQIPEGQEDTYQPPADVMEKSKAMFVRLAAAGGALEPGA